MKKLTQKERKTKMKKMVKVMDAALKDLDDFIILEIDSSLCDRYRYNDLLRAAKRLAIVQEYLGKCSELSK